MEVINHIRMKLHEYTKPCRSARFFLFKKVVKTSWHEVVMTSLRAVKVCRLTKFAAVRCNDIPTSIRLNVKM